MSFLYYKPGGRVANNVSFEEVVAWGLGYHFDETDGIASRDVYGNTPDGREGFVFGRQAGFEHQTIGIFPDEQDWFRGADGKPQPIPGTDGVFLGRYINKPILPDDLERPAMLSGYPIDLRDGKTWIVPLCRQFEETAENYLANKLPVALALDAEGKVCDGQILEAYRYLWDASGKYALNYLDIRNRADEINLEENDIFADAIKFLGANYRVGSAEVAFLGLFDRDIYNLPLACCLMAIDYGTICAFLDESEQKKTASEVPDLPNTSVGQVDLPRDTAQPMPT